MTAFDILTFSSGTDLSAMLGAGPGKERVFVSEHAAAVLRRVEEATRKEGYRVRRRTREGKNKSTGLVYVEEESGDMVAKVAVFKIAGTLSVVEVVMGDGVEAALFWKDRLEPAVEPPAGA